MPRSTATISGLRSPASPSFAASTSIDGARGVTAGTSTEAPTKVRSCPISVAALLGLRLETSYEGQAAMELEALAEDAGEPLVPQSSQEVDDVVRDVVEGIARGRKRSSIAAAFHLGLARVLAKAATSVSREAGLSRVALGGGSFQNRILQLQTEGSVSAMRCCVFRRT